MAPQDPALPLRAQGVAPSARTPVWMHVSGAAKRKASVSASYYSMMAQAGQVSEHAGEIEQARHRALTRTCQAHIAA